MASFTLTNVNDKWADGVTVSVFARDAFGNATGSAVTSAAVSGGNVSFSGLLDATNYVASQGGKTVQFRTPNAATSSGIAASAVDAKGDLLVGTADDTISRLAVGSNSQVLTADSAQPTGVKWAAAAAGGSIGLVTALHKALGLAFDPIHAATGQAPTAGVGNFIKVPVERAGTISTVLLEITTAGTGATALANCFVGVYNKTGTLIGKSADQSVSWATAGQKAVTVTAEAGQSLAVTPADGEFVTVEFHVGTQSTTPVAMVRSTNTAARANANISAPADYRFASNAGPFTTAPPGSVPTLAQAVAYWVGVA